MVLRLVQILCLLRIYSKNGYIINVQLRAHYLRYTNLHFANSPTLLLRQILLFLFLQELAYNASNTKTNLPNPALCLILMGKSFYGRFLNFLPPDYFLYPKPKPRRYRVVVARLRLVNIFQLLAGELANIFGQSFVVIHSHNIPGMALPNSVDERKPHHANDSLLWLFRLLFFLILR